MDRRQVLRRAGLALLAPFPGSLVAAGDDAAPAGQFAPPAPLAPIRASAERLIALGACTRPFRAQGPRIEAERVGRRTVVHHYGHGGAGWSLSWGSAAVALPLIQATGARSIAVIGCGAIGLTTALTAQRAGLGVRIYTRDRPPDVASSFATGVWSPDSRICTAAHATPEFENRWQRMARDSYRTWQTMLGLPGLPVAWHDGYALSDLPFGQPGSIAGDKAGSGQLPGEPEYPRLESRLLRDLRPAWQQVAPGQHPFPVAHVAHYTLMHFNITALSRLLLDEFLLNGGEIVTRTFTNPGEFAGLKEKTVVNATGYGARALLGDESIIPVRGQTARLIPQPEVTYGLFHLQKDLFVVPRGDGIVVQAQGRADFGNPDPVPDRAASVAAIGRLAELFPAVPPSRPAVTPPGTGDGVS